MAAPQKRYNNPFSRAIERVQNEKSETGASQNGTPANGRTLPPAAAQTIDNAAVDDSTAIGAPVNDSAPTVETNLLDKTPISNPSFLEKILQPAEASGDHPRVEPQVESWRWSEPPDFVQKLDARGIGTPSAATQGAASNTSLSNAAVAASSLANKPARPEFLVREINAERVEPHLVAITQPRSTHAEEYRNLRTHILQTAARRKMQAIVVASAKPSEGKSTTAVNLAWLIAQTDGVSALIIDSDLRLPSLGDYLGIPEKPGLSEVLGGEVRLEEAIVRLEPSGLHLLPGGEPRDDVAELLSGHKFKEILTQARGMFDYIILDVPPLGIFTDAAVMIDQADGALLVVRSGRTRYTTVNRLLDTLPRERMLGVVLNGSDEELDESHYNYYYTYDRKKTVATK